MNPVTASTTLLGQRPGEALFEIHLQVGVPHVASTGEWACSISLKPVYERVHDVHAENSFQCLCLASSVLLDLLHGFKQDGGLLFTSPGEPLVLEAYAFGVASRASA
jgi:hypothetical protein